ncbi:MAG: histidinol dehydrogenase [Sedimentisphaeraceae bacterium JB056]
MNKKLKDILTSKNDNDFQQKMQDIRREHSMAEWLRNNKEIADRVRGVVTEVAERGDEAVSEFTERFDNVTLTAADFRVSDDYLRQAHADIDQSLLADLRMAIDNVKEYQSSIFVGNNETEGIRYRPLNRIAVCIPGASAPLPSTLIMTAVPAMVAGVKEIVVITPPRFKGNINPVIAALCYELGIKEVYRIGGAQAVAALAWGTDTIEKVDKIVGPGNDYVQMAKKEVFGLCDMDSFAGPSDVLIVADENAKADWVAADMLSQAEHNPGAALLVTSSSKLAGNVLRELETQCSELSRSDETFECLIKYSAIIVVDDLDEMIDFANDFAAEHLEVQCGQASMQVADRIQNAGAIFIGDYSPVAVGDYWAGPSHTLPTRQSSKYFSALTSNEFVKSSSIINYSKDMLMKNGKGVIAIAKTEGLDAHAASVEKRINN